MIKRYAFLLVAFICFGLSGYGQGSESFTNSNAPPSSNYADGSYLGDNAVTWTYVQCRDEWSFPITGKGLMLRSVSQQSRVTSSPVPNGIGSFTCRLLKGFTSVGNRQVELFVNGVSQGTSLVWDNTTIQTFTVDAINMTGDVIIEIRNITPFQVVIDDIEWTAASTNTVDACNLQFPENGNITVGSEFNVYAQVFKAGVTEATFPDPRITAWIGYSTQDNHPNSSGWNWLPALFSVATDNRHEYVANIGSVLTSGTYYYASRFQIDGGPYRYGGYNGSGGGFWDGTLNQSGLLSIDTVDFCNLQFPRAGSITLGDDFFVYGQVYEQGITPGVGQGPGITAQIGYSLNNSDPNTWTSWIPAVYNGACLDCNFGQNDEYMANLGAIISNPGTYYYATRFQLNNGSYLYGGIFPDGSGGGSWDGSTAVSGQLQVMAPVIRVEGNLGTFPIIPNGDASPQGTDNTLFAAQFIGASQSKSYRIQNLGNLDLNVSNVTILGANPDDFTITTMPTATILPGEFSILEIEFSPLVSGVRNAVVTIANNDLQKNPYTFAIRGTGRCLTTTSSTVPTRGPLGTIVTITGANFDTSTVATMNGTIMDTTFINPTTIEVTVPQGAATGHIVVVNNLNCTSTLPFQVIGPIIGGCNGDANLTELLISEITDATVGGLTYVEIYNGTGTTRALGDYSIGTYNNGSSTPNSIIRLQDVNLENNGTFVLAIGVSPNQTNSCPQSGGNGQLANQTSQESGINKKDNEHDVIRLLKGNGLEVIDQFGVFMDDSWMDATLLTGDRGFNFRRLNTASPLPNPNFNLQDWNIMDWVGSGTTSCGTNDYSDIGYFDYSGGTPPRIILQPMPPSSTCVLEASLVVTGIEGVPGGSPLTYQWYYNVPGTLEWIDILDTDSNYTGQQSATLILHNTWHLDGFQYYVQIRANTLSCSSVSNAIRLNIHQTTWDGVTWIPSVPDLNTIAIMDGNYTTSPSTGSFSSCSLVVNSGATLHITDGYYIEVGNNVMVRGISPSDSGLLLVDSKGALVQRGDDANAGTFKLEIPATSRVSKSTALKQNWYDYTYWSSPVIDDTVESALSMSPSSRRFYFEAANYLDANGDDIDDNGDDWQLATGPMVPGLGYAATSSNSGTFPRIDSTIFYGQFNTGNISVPIHTNTVEDNDWNFIGNPYPSAIDFKTVYAGNSHVIDGAAYLWSHYSPPSAGNPGNQRLNFSNADYAIITTGSGNTAGASGLMPSDFIPSGQGFFVKGLHNGGTLTFKNTMRMADATSNSQFFRTFAPQIPNKFWINLTSDNGVFNQVLVAYVEGATNGVDGFAYDAERNLSSGLSAILYTEIVDSPKKYAIQGKAVNSLNLDEEVPLGLKTSIAQPTIYNLSIAQVQGHFFEENHLYIKDNLLNIEHNLSLSDYKFPSAVGDFKDRFVIVFRDQMLSVLTPHQEIIELSIVELNNGNVGFSVNENLNIKAVCIIDTLGRILNYFHGHNSEEVYNLSHLSQATYLAKVELSNGQLLTKRFVLGTRF